METAEWRSVRNGKIQFSPRVRGNSLHLQSPEVVPPVFSVRAWRQPILEWRELLLLGFLPVCVETANFHRRMYKKTI